MGFWTRTRTEAEKAQQRALKEHERAAKAQRKEAAKAHKAQAARVKQEQKAAKRQQHEANKCRKQARKVAKKATQTRVRLARKTEKERRQRLRRQVRRARLQSTVVDAVTAPPFAKSAGCYVCGKTFGHALHRRRHHCRQCRESCCLQCTSRTRRMVPRYGMDKPQKVCVVCETLVFNNDERPREPVEAVAALAASNRATTLRRPHSAPLPLTTDAAVAMPLPRRSRARSTKSKSGSLWTLPIRPLLKKKHAEQRRNRNMDLDLQIEKQALFGGRSIELQPQAIVRPAP